MTDPDFPGDAEVQPAGRPAPRMPRWIKLSLIIVLAIAALLIVLQLTGLAGDHGPGQHKPDGHSPVEHAP